jgi:hypothetical protein
VIRTSASGRPRTEFDPQRHLYFAWWFRGTVDKPKIEGLKERLDGAKEQHPYLDRKLADAKDEIAKLEQQIEDKAAPELLRATVNSTMLLIDEAHDVNTHLGNTISDDGRKADVGRIIWNKVPRG